VKPPVEEKQPDKAPSQESAPPIIAPSNDPIDKILIASYNYYLKNFISSDGRPLGDSDVNDLDQDGNREEKNTYSEGVSYVLLRAGLMNDKTTFDNAWTWTKNNLQRKSIKKVYNPDSKAWEPMATSKRDHLFAWRYHPGVGNAPGGVLSFYDFDPAADADQDIAAALLLAHKKWGGGGKINYLSDARAILDDIWNKETHVIAGKRVLLGGDTQIYTKDPFTGEQTYGINPSYLRPTYYSKLFAEADPEHDWPSMVAPAYELIEQASDATMHNEAKEPVQGSVNFVPDWIAVDKHFAVRDHGWRIDDHAGRNDYYAGGDAYRTLFWMGVQAQIDPQDTTAQKYFSDRSGTKADFGPYTFLKNQLDTHGTIYSGYAIDGSIHWETEALHTLSAYMYYFTVAADKTSTEKIFKKIMDTYHPEGFWGINGGAYYAQNWIWLVLFSMAKGPKGFLGKGGIHTPSQFPFEVPIPPANITN
jgi:endoglucanase